MASLSSRSSYLCIETPMLVFSVSRANLNEVTGLNPVESARLEFVLSVSIVIRNSPPGRFQPKHPPRRREHTTSIRSPGEW